MFNMPKSAPTKKLMPKEKDILLRHAESVFLSYLTLDTMCTKTFCSFKVDVEQKFTLQECCIDLINLGIKSKTIFINNTACDVNIKNDDPDNDFVINITTVAIQSNSSIKQLDRYTNDEYAKMLSNQTFTLDKLSGEKYASGIRTTTNILLGGRDKIDLYRSHLVNLHLIIQRIKQDRTDTMLVALATGSGKTFTQALWLQILYSAEMIGVFTMPRNLVTQFRKDMDRLLPSSITDNITVLQEGDGYYSNALADGQKIIVTSVENFLDNCYLADIPTNTRIFLSFDEQHAIAKFESRYKKASVLAKKYISLYLTATPSQETYEACGSRPVAMMSPAQKKQAGQGQLSEIKTIRVEFDSDLNRKYSFFGKKFILNEVISFAAGIFLPKISSASIEAIELMPYQVTVTGDSVNPKASMPMARKMLWLIDDNESLINFFHNYDLFQGFYSNGALTQQNAGKLGLSIKKNEIKLASVKKIRLFNEQTIGLNHADIDRFQTIAEKGMRSQVKQNMLHSLIEYLLIEKTGFSQIELNEIRQKNIDELKSKVRESLQRNLSLDVLKVKLSAKIGDFSTKLIHPLLIIIHNTMHEKLYEDNFLSYICKNNFTDDLFPYFNDKPNFDSQFNEYYQYFRLVAVMANMQDAESPVEDSRPFNGMLHERRQAFKDKKLDGNAKKRKRSSIEQLVGLLGGKIEDDYFNPQYLDASINEETVDQLFKLGFIGIYISNKKGMGFNDPNLHTVVSITENTLTMNANPTIQVQSYGRTRGLDPSIKPAYINVFGRRIKSQFDLNLLDKNKDYYPKYFKALRTYNIEYIKNLSRELADNIIQAYYECSNAGGEIDSAKFRRKTLVLIAKKLRQLNINNTFNIQLSRAQLTEVIINANKIIDEEIYRIQHPYEVSYATKFGVSFIKGIFTAWNFRRDFSTFNKLKKAEQSLKKEGTLNQADIIYLKIIRSNISFGTLESLALVMGEFASYAKQIQEELSQNNKDEQIKKLLSLMQGFMDLQKADSELNGINEKHRNELLVQFVNFIPDLLINFDKIIKQLIKHFSPILFNPEFIKNIDILIGNLDEKDIAFLIGKILALENTGIDSKELATNASIVFFELINKLRQQKTDEFVEKLQAWLLQIQCEVLGTLLREISSQDENKESIVRALNLLDNLKDQPDNPSLKLELAQILSKLSKVQETENIGAKLLHTKTLKTLMKAFYAPTLIYMAVNDSICYFHRCHFDGKKNDEESHGLIASNLSANFKGEKLRLPYREIELNLSRSKNVVYVTDRLDKVKQSSNSRNTDSLKSIQENVLKRVWWKLKYSTWKFSIKRIFNNIMFAIKETASYIWQGMKFAANKIKEFVLKSNKTNNNFDLNQQESKYIEDFTSKLNKTKNISTADTKERTCPVDMLEPILEELENEDRPMAR